MKAYKNDLPEQANIDTGVFERGVKYTVKDMLNAIKEALSYASSEPNKFLPEMQNWLQQYNKNK